MLEPTPPGEDPCHQKRDNDQTPPIEQYDEGTRTDEVEALLDRRVARKRGLCVAKRHDRLRSQLVNPRKTSRSLSVSGNLGLLIAAILSSGVDMPSSLAVADSAMHAFHIFKEVNECIGKVSSVFTNILCCWHYRCLARLAIVLHKNLSGLVFHHALR